MELRRDGRAGAVLPQVAFWGNRFIVLTVQMVLNLDIFQQPRHPQFYPAAHLSSCVPWSRLILQSHPTVVALKADASALSAPASTGLRMVECVTALI